MNRGLAQSVKVENRENLHQAGKPMPLAFDTLNHGMIAFGFFNIETDMLLIEKYFLFGSDFCGHINAMVDKAADIEYRSEWPVYIIEDRAEIGDLMGAIHGIRYTGFIGKLYRSYPFPEMPEAFKQKTKGDQSQAFVREMISGYARRIRLPVAVQMQKGEVDIGEYKFSTGTFGELIKYIWRGGYPGWQDDIRPPYVQEMQTKIENHRQGLFEKIELS